MSVLRSVASSAARSAAAARPTSVAVPGLAQVTLSHSANATTSTHSSRSVSAAQSFSSSATQQLPSPSSSNISTSKPVPSSRPQGSSSGAHVSRLSPRAPPQRQEPYSPITVAVVKTLAKMMGYNSRESTAIRVTSDLFDACADAVELNAHFWYEECGLPRTYQTWFQLTNLHVWLLLVRFRAFPTRDVSQSYAQELINHFFIDAESRMRERFGVQTSRLVKGYMRDMHMQQRGAVLSLDEALGRNSDAHMAAALWRNLWGGGWGIVGGVKRKLRGIDRSDKPGNPKVYSQDEEEGLPDLAVDKAAPALPASNASKPLHSNGLEEKMAQVPPPNNRASSLIPAHHGDIEALAFAQHLAGSVDFVRIQVEHLAEMSDQSIMQGSVGKGASQLFVKI
ncbi:hypothetical protein CF319_g3133 [Tilletia indica]|nr:hypothetical protein CF319_g3133 [Tilletia indica]